MQDLNLRIWKKKLSKVALYKEIHSKMHHWKIAEQQR